MSPQEPEAKLVEKRRTYCSYSPNPYRKRPLLRRIHISNAGTTSCKRRGAEHSCDKPKDKEHCEVVCQRRRYLEKHKECEGRDVDGVSAYRRNLAQGSQDHRAFKTAMLVDRTEVKTVDVEATTDALS